LEEVDKVDELGIGIAIRMDVTKVLALIWLLNNLTCRELVFVGASGARNQIRSE